MESVAALLFFVGIHCSVQGQAVSSYDDIGDAESEWINDLLDWRQNVADWKDQVERGCFVNKSDTNWTSLFECSDFSGIQCVNQTALNSTKDPFNCTVEFCEDGRYSNNTVLRLINREQSDIYKKLITIYKEDLIQCRERTCPEDTYTTDQATTPTSTSSTPTATLYETTTVSSAITTAPADWYDPTDNYQWDQTAGSGATTDGH